MKGLQALFRVKETYIGIAAAIAFQLIFFSIWMTAYDKVDERTENLSIGLMNEDLALGQEIANEMKEFLPFSTKTFSSLYEAEKELDSRSIQMIIHIPSDFSAQLQNGNKASINYFINQANASLSKTMMEGVAKQVTEQINHQLYALQQGETVKVFSQQLEQLPLENNLSSNLQKTISSTIVNLQDRVIDYTITKANNAEGFAANFVPLMVIISSFVGAMVMIMQHQQAAHIVQNTISKWSLFLSRQIINFTVAFTLPLLTLGLMKFFSIVSDEGFLTIYLFQGLMFWAFLCLAQVFVLIFGNLGMVFNICALSLQLVTSGVLVPKGMLSDFYKQLASILPATYGADGYYTIIFGGSSDNLLTNSSSLGIIIIVTLAISTVAVALKRTNKIRATETMDALAS